MSWNNAPEGEAQLPARVRILVRIQAEVEAVDESLRGVVEEPEGRAMEYSVDYF